jgi:hypothetical protein
MSMPEAERFVRDVEIFERRDRWRTLFSIVVAVLVWAVAVISSSVIVNRARREVQRLERRATQLRERNTKLQADKSQLQKLAGVIGTLPSVVKPKVYVQRVADVLDPQGRPIYDFILFLSVPEARRAEIRRVEYIINNPARLNRVARGGSAEASFAMAYRGNGCFNPVLVRVTPIRGDQFIIPFDECAAWAETGTVQGNS